MRPIFLSGTAAHSNNSLQYFEVHFRIEFVWNQKFVVLGSNVSSNDRKLSKNKISKFGTGFLPGQNELMSGHECRQLLGIALNLQHLKDAIPYHPNSEHSTCH